MIKGRELRNQELKTDYVYKSTESLTKFVITSEKYRKDFAEKLRQTLYINDDFKNKIFEL